MSCFNVIFTFLPPIAIGVFDQIVSSRMLDKYPQMYMLGQKNVFFNQKKFWGWIANATYHSIVKYNNNRNKSICSYNYSYYSFWA